MSSGYVMAAESTVDGRIESALQKKKVKKPGFLSRWLMKKLVESAEFENPVYPEVINHVISKCNLIIYVSSSSLVFFSI
jgi:hypothetical protein